MSIVCSRRAFATAWHIAQEALDYALQYGRDLDRAKADTSSACTSTIGRSISARAARQAVRELLARGHAAGVIPQRVEPEFID